MLLPSVSMAGSAMEAELSQMPAARVRAALAEPSPRTKRAAVSARYSLDHADPLPSVEHCNEYRFFGFRIPGLSISPSVAANALECARAGCPLVRGHGAGHGYRARQTGGDRRDGAYRHAGRLVARRTRRTGRVARPGDRRWRGRRCHDRQYLCLPVAFGTGGRPAQRRPGRDRRADSGHRPRSAAAVARRPRWGWPTAPCRR